VALAVLATPAHAAQDEALYPAAQCAALWYGFDDYARVSRTLDRTEGDLARAEAFRAIAYRLDGGRTDRVDAFVQEQRVLMRSMIDAMIYGGDEFSRDLFRRLSETCETFAGTHPETEALR
jgi:hypothetical protein